MDRWKLLKFYIGHPLYEIDVPCGDLLKGGGFMCPTVEQYNMESDQVKVSKIQCNQNWEVNKYLIKANKYVN
jgi:hypothetical protein